MSIEVIVFCTVSTGLDAIATVLRHGHRIQRLFGLHPDAANPDKISGYVDISEFAQRWNVPYSYVISYDLSAPEDIEVLSALNVELIWVAGWQRLIPEWLIRIPKYGAIGAHGSPDGISRGRGRSPQNWAIMLGAKVFHLALFSIRAGIDDGPIIAQKAFSYEESDDIQISYKKSALCVGEMVADVLRNPSAIEFATPQTGCCFYYPKRSPDDGSIDWNLSRSEIAAHCRALTRPYPGIRTKSTEGHLITIWRCSSFDDNIDGEPGEVSHIFEDGSILVNCGDGRLLLTDFTCNQSKPLESRIVLDSVPFRHTIERIARRHQDRYPHLTLSPRLTVWNDA